MGEPLDSDKSKIVVPSPRPVAIREIQLINRDEEMRLLREAADRAIHGKGGVVFLHGEAGIGKTRLARELGVYARSRGMHVLSGRCPALFKMDGVPPYILWEEVVRNYLETCTPEQLLRVIGSYPVEISKLVPELKHKLGTFPQSFPLNPENSRDRLFEAVSQFITNISRETSLLVILDDLQWTDRSSLLLLHYLARGVYKEALLILGAYRETYIDKKHPLYPVLAEFNRERLLESVSIKRLSFSETSEMVKRILEQDELPNEFCELIYKKTDGNPFFIEEVIKSLKEEEIIYRKGKEWKFRDIAEIEFPETVKDVIRMRISRLDDESQEVLTLASFFGKDFVIEALQEVTALEKEKLLESLDKILKAGLFKHRVLHGKDICSFVDIIVRDVVHEEISPFKRRNLHRAAGSALEKVYAQELDDHLGELALHFLEGGDEKKALSYFLKAGENAAKIYANSEAISYFQSSLDLLTEKKGKLPEKAQILERLGDIKHFSGKHEESMGDWNRAIDIQNQLSEKENIARLHRKIANVFWEELGNAKKAEEHHRKAREALSGMSDNIEMAHIYEDMAHMYYRTGDIDKALPWGKKALEIGEKLNEYEVLASSYTSLGTVFSFKGELNRAQEYLEKAEKIAIEKGYMETALRAKNNLATAIPPHENERIFRLQKETYELAKKVGLIALQSWTASVLGFTYFQMGKLDEALLLMDEAYILDKRSGNMAHLPTSLVTYGALHQIRGEWDKSIRYYEEALDLAKKSGEFQMIIAAYGLLGWFYIEQNDFSKGLEYHEKELEVAKKAGAMSACITAYTSIARCYIELERIEKASKIIEKIKEAAPTLQDKYLDIMVDLLNARLFRAQKKWKESIRLYDKALQQSESLNAKRWRVYDFARQVLYEYAQIYLKRNASGDREKALKLLNQSLDLFQRIGATVYVERINSQIIGIETGHTLTTRTEPKTVKISKTIVANKVPTGFAPLDNMLYGGIPKEYAVVLTSPSCDQRDKIVRKFLETGTDKKQATFYITCGRASGIKNLVEKHPDFHLLICNPQANKIIEDKPAIHKMKGVENLNEVNIVLTTAFRKLAKKPKKTRRICIEIISDVLLQHQALQTRRWLTGLLAELKSKGFTTLAVMDPGMHTVQETRAVIDLFDGEISIREKENAQGSKKLLKIKKMYDQDYSKEDFELRN